MARALQEEGGRFPGKVKLSNKEGREFHARWGGVGWSGAGGVPGSDTSFCAGRLARGTKRLSWQKSGAAARLGSLPGVSLSSLMFGIFFF